MAVLDEEHPWDRFVFLGDAVLAGPEPDAVLSLLRTLDGSYIMGNHDREILELEPDEHTTDPGRKWAQWHRTSISDRNLEFLAGFVDECALPMTDIGNVEFVDLDRAVEVIRHALDAGVNYIDCGFQYGNFQSEIAVGRALRGRLGGA